MDSTGAPRMNQPDAQPTRGHALSPRCHPLYSTRMTPEQVVQKFCAAVAKRDIKEICSFFSEDAVYHNIPVEPVKGHAAIEGILQQFIGPATEAEFEMLAIASAGNKVLTERVDRFTIMGKKIELPVMGTFEVNNEGKITVWRDYFDMAQFTKQMA